MAIAATAVGEIVALLMIGKMMQDGYFFDAR
jgi:hypothetical protein